MKNTRHFQQQCKDFGYKEVKKYLDGELNKEEMIEKLKMETRRYAKRQLTWFRANKELIWLNGRDDVLENVNKILQDCDIK